MKSKSRSTLLALTMLLAALTLASYASDQENAPLLGSSGDDTLSGNSAANRLQGKAGNDQINGGGGLDTAVYAGRYQDFAITHDGQGYIVKNTSGTEGTDVLVNVERLEFSNAAIALDINGIGGQAYRIYQAAFDRAPDLGGLGYWMSVMDTGVTLKQVAEGFVASTEFKALYGDSPSSADIVTRLYANVLHRAPDSGGFNYWLDILESKAATPAEVLASFSESAENQAALIAVIGNGFAYTPYSLG